MVKCRNLTYLSVLSTLRVVEKLWLYWHVTLRCWCDIQLMNINYWKSLPSNKTIRWVTSYWIQYGCRTKLTDYLFSKTTPIKLVKLYSWCHTFNIFASLIIFVVVYSFFICYFLISFPIILLKLGDRSLQAEHKKYSPPEQREGIVRYAHSKNSSHLSTNMKWYFFQFSSYMCSGGLLSMPWQ